MIANSNDIIFLKVVKTVQMVEYILNHLDYAISAAIGMPQVIVIV